MTAFGAGPPCAIRPRAPRFVLTLTGSGCCRAPAALLMVTMLIGPMLAVVALSFTDYQLGASSFEWIGWRNFLDLTEERAFWMSLGNTLL